MILTSQRHFRDTKWVRNAVQRPRPLVASPPWTCHHFGPKVHIGRQELALTPIRGRPGKFHDDKMYPTGYILSSPPRLAPFRGSHSHPLPLPRPQPVPIAHPIRPALGALQQHQTPHPPRPACYRRRPQRHRQIPQPLRDQVKRWHRPSPGAVRLAVARRPSVAPCVRSPQ